MLYLPHMITSDFPQGNGITLYHRTSHIVISDFPQGNGITLYHRMSHIVISDFPQGNGITLYHRTSTILRPEGRVTVTAPLIPVSIIKLFVCL